jgi:hypothetical protein
MGMTENAANIAICNLSLGLLGEKSITLSGSSANHTYCTTFFDDSRDEILAQHPWNWARKRAYAVQTTDPLWGLHNTSFAYNYTVPTDCLRLLTIDNDPDARWGREGSVIITDRGSIPADYSASSVEYLAGEYITSDDSGSDLTYSVDTAFTSSSETTDLATYCTALAANYRVLKTEYVYQVTDVSTYPQWMRKCLVWNLAIYLSSPILQSESSGVTLNLQSALFGGAKNFGYLQMAKSIDAQEEGLKTISTTTLTGSRYGGRRWARTVGRLE